MAVTFPDWVNRALHDEAAGLYARLSPDSYCKHAVSILNGSTPKSKMQAAGGLRGLGNSMFLFAAAAEGVITANLFYLVAVCEGILMPHLKPLVDLAEEDGNKGPLKQGRYQELERARRNFGPAIQFLATHGAPTLAASPLLLAETQGWQSDRLAGLRNSAAHFAFRLEIELTDATKDPDVGSKMTAGVLEQFESLRRAIKLTPKEPSAMIADIKRSNVRYEPDIKKPLTNASPALSFEALRQRIFALDSNAFALMFAYAEAGVRLQADKKVFLGGCASCPDGIIVAPRSSIGTDLPCPACSAMHTVPSF